MLNPYIDAQGIFHGILFDIYDFELERYRNINDFLILANNLAWLLQTFGILHIYYEFIPIEFEW